MRLLSLALAGWCSLSLAAPSEREVVLWAWEKKENLSWVDPSTTKVAILTATVDVSGDHWDISRRQNPALIAPNVQIIRVLRVESRRVASSNPDPTRFAKALLDIVAPLSFVELQIDFDARVSQREWYRAVLKELRQQLNSSKRLSMTALASWCLGDAWLDDLAVDEVVPMPFRMGRDTAPVRRHLTNFGRFTYSRCQAAVGVSLDEPLPVIPEGRLYIFNPKPWATTDRDLVETLRRRH